MLVAVAPPSYTDAMTTIQTDPHYTIQCAPHGGPVAVSIETWRAWTGRRYIDGIEVHGPVYMWLSPERGDRLHARRCACPTCQGNLDGWVVGGPKWRDAP